MDVFRNAFHLWARHNSLTASRDSESEPEPEPEPDPDMSRHNGASSSTPTPTSTSIPATIRAHDDSPSRPSPSPVPSSSPLSSVDTPDLFSTPTAATPNDMKIETIDVAFASNGDGDGDKDRAGAAFGDGGSGGSSENGKDNEHQFDLQKPSRYRKAQGLPPELKEHCRVYLEEALPRQAIFLLDSLLSTRAADAREPVYCPPPSQIALLCSILVHPDFTTRPKEPDWPQISLQALVYLRGLLTVVGPVNAGFKESVLFGTNATSDPDPDSHGLHHGSSDADERGLVRLAPRHGNDSVWQRGRDFFSVVGWALNCSASYPERWQWWGRWLDFMLDLLDADLRERHRLDLKNGSDGLPLLQNSILASYITQRSTRTTDATMWIMKALFADGSSPSTSVFQEIWHREHKSRSRQTPNKRKHERINIDKGEYGGYLDDESIHSSQVSEPPTPQKKGSKSAWEEEALEAAYIETIPARQRLFSLISYLCYALGDAAPIEFSNLYQKYEQRIKEQPLSVFSSYINQSTSTLRVDQQIEMLQGVLFLFMPAGALNPRKVDRQRFEQGGISPAILERCFLPYPANTIEVEDHIKMSLLLENLLMVVWQHGEADERFSDHLGEAVQQGIKARWEKINKKKTRGRGRPVNETDLGVRAILKASDARLGWLVDAIEQDGTDDDAMEEDEDM